MSAAAVRLTPEAIARIRYWVERLPPVPTVEPAELPEPATVAEPVEAPPAPPDHQPLEEAPAQPVEAPRVEHEEASRPPPTRDQLRSRRPREVRARSIQTYRISRVEQAVQRALHPDADRLPPLPATRGDCPEERPCPHVRCRYHLFLDVDRRTGAIKLNFPDIEVEDLPQSCALDVAGREGATLEEVSALMNLTRERVRQIELIALARLKRKNPRLVQLIDQEGERGRRRLPILAQNDNEENEGDEGVEASEGDRDG